MAGTTPLFGLTKFGGQALLYRNSNNADITCLFHQEEKHHSPALEMRFLPEPCQEIQRHSQSHGTQCPSPERRTSG